MVPFSAFVLAAGFGTRLMPLTAEIPKPLLPVGAEPQLASTLRVLHEAGARPLCVNVHHLHQQIINFINGLQINIQVNYEEKILGTAGGIAAMRAHLRAPVLLVNGDIVADLPIAALLAAEAEQPGGLTLAVTDPRARASGAPPGGAGTVGLDSEGRVVRLRGETFGPEANSADYMGVACLGSTCLQALPREGCLIGDVALPWLRQGRSIRTVRSAAPFIDLGDPGSYLEANLEWVAGGTHLGPGATWGPGVQLRRSILGAGAQVGGSGLVDRTVVLPGAIAVAPLERAIVLPSGKVVRVP